LVVCASATECDATSAASANFRFDRDAPAFLFRQRRAFAFGMNALGDIVVGSDPVFAAFDRPVHNQNGTAVRRFYDPVHRLALTHRAENLGAILFSVNIEAAGRYPVLDQVQQRASGLNDIRRQTIHLDVAVIADQNALVRIEQYDTLRHVVDDQRQKCAVSSGARAPLTPPTHHHHRGKAHDDRHGVHLPALLQDGVQADPPPERGGLYTAASFY
jgi:hypothetical protein